MKVNQVLKDSRGTDTSRAFSVRTDTAYNFTCACGASMNTASSAQLDKFVKEHNTEHIERVIELRKTSPIALTTETHKMQPINNYHNGGVIDGRTYGGTLEQMP